MAQIERQQAFKKEIFLWIVVAVSILLFISNFGIGGHLGNAVSGFLFGLFGMMAYIFPLVLLVGSFFAVSNKGNSYAIMKLVMTLVFIWFICVFMYRCKCLFPGFYHLFRSFAGSSRNERKHFISTIPECHPCIS